MRGYDMVTLLKNNGNGIYILESDDDDWITDHAGDPGECDLDALTEGTDYIYLKNIVSTQWKGKDSWLDQTVGSGEYIQYNYGDDQEIYVVNARLADDTLTNLYAAAYKIMCFWKTHNRQTAPKTYLVNQFDTDVFEDFPNQDLTSKNYAEFKVSQPMITRDYQSDSLAFNVSILCKIQWGV